MSAKPNSRPRTMLSAITPSNQPTLGNFIGAIRNWVKLQNDYECFFMVADMHAITVRQDPRALLARTYRGIAEYIASGLDPSKVTLFVQSHVPEHAELAWILTCFSYMGELSRMTQFKDKSARQGESIPVGLFSYPLLMAADILLYDTHLVPVGEDQKQHIELTRDVAIRMTKLFGDDLFVVPEPYIPPVGARVMSLQDPATKMSKSDPDPNATLFLSDSDDVIRKKVKRAVTDSGAEIRPGDDKPGVTNLLTIQSALTGKSIAELVAAYAGKQYGHLKADTAEICIDAIAPIRGKADELLEDMTYLGRVLKEGAVHARSRARQTVDRVSERVGFIPR
jgi:tryptophanyl-tRNA synthetase